VTKLHNAPSVDEEKAKKGKKKAAKS